MAMEKDSTEKGGFGAGGTEGTTEGVLSREQAALSSPLLQVKKLRQRRKTQASQNLPWTSWETGGRKEGRWNVFLGL